MATILEFRRIDEGEARTGKPAEGTLGEIIIFPGVRIERHTDAPPQNSAPTRRRVQRVRKKSRA